MTYRIQITVDGTTYPIHRDVAHRHPAPVHLALETSSETELQRGLDAMNVEDWYDADSRHRGPDASGLEMFHN